MYLVLRRGAIGTLERAGELAGAAAVRCVRELGDAPAFAAWHERPRKVCLRARNPAQWRQVLELPHAGEEVVALPPMPAPERGTLLAKLQAMSGELEAPGTEVPESGFAYVLNPAAPMSSGKTIAQIAHAAVEAAGTGEVEEWVAAGCPARVVAPDAAGFARAEASGRCVARVVDAGLTELPPGTLTVVAVA